MRVLLKLVLACEPDAAWRAIRSPSVLGAVSSPLTTFSPADPLGFPQSWPNGEHHVRVRAFGVVPIGEQVIGVSYPQRDDEVRIMLDTGRGVSGPLSAITRWEHSLAVAPAPGGKTLYRDRLVFEAGLLTPLLWPVYWAFWQWRGIRMQRLAPTWRA